VISPEEHWRFLRDLDHTDAHDVVKVHGSLTYPHGRVPEACRRRSLASDQQLVADRCIVVFHNRDDGAMAENSDQNSGPILLLATVVA
jgi:hypothetical protein